MQLQWLLLWPTGHPADQAVFWGACVVGALIWRRLWPYIKIVLSILMFGIVVGTFFFVTEYNSSHSVPNHTSKVIHDVQESIQTSQSWAWLTNRTSQSWVLLANQTSQTWALFVDTVWLTGIEKRDALMGVEKKQETTIGSQYFSTPIALYEWISTRASAVLLRLGGGEEINT